MLMSSYLINLFVLKCLSQFFTFLISNVYILILDFLNLFLHLFYNYLKILFIITHFTQKCKWSCFSFVLFVLQIHFLITARNYTVIIITKKTLRNDIIMNKFNPANGVTVFNPPQYMEKSRKTPSTPQRLHQLLWREKTHTRTQLGIPHIYMPGM